MLLAPPHIQGSNALCPKKHLKNSKVREYRQCLIVQWILHGFGRTTYIVFLIYVGLPGVLWVLPDSYIDVKNKDYGGWFVQLLGEVKEQFFFTAVTKC